MWGDFKEKEGGHTLPDDDNRGKMAAKCRGEAQTQPRNLRVCLTYRSGPDIHSTFFRDWTSAPFVALNQHSECFAVAISHKRIARPETGMDLSRL